MSQTSGQYVFVSFHKRDLDFAHDLALDIAQESFPVWMDRIRIRRVGTSLKPTISAAIQDAACVVLVVSRSSRTSDWVAWEVNEALQHHVPVLQLLTDEGGGWPGLEDQHYATVAGSEYTKGMRRLMTTIGSLCPRDVELAHPEPLIPLFLDLSTRVDEIGLQQRLAKIEALQGRLSIDADHVAVSRTGDELQILLDATNAWISNDKNPQLARSVIRHTEDQMHQISAGVAEIINNYHGLKAFAGRQGGFWSVYVAKAVSEFVRRCRWRALGRLVNYVGDVPHLRGLVSRWTPLMEASDVAADTGGLLTGDNSVQLDVFHHSGIEKVSGLRFRYAARTGGTFHFSAPKDSSIAHDVESYYHVLASEYPYQVAGMMIPEMMLVWFIHLGEAHTFWDFDDCAVGLH